MKPRDRGAALVEAVLVVPILIFVLLSIIEVGGALKTYSGTASAVRMAGRSASLAGADPLADATILEEVALQVASIDADEVEVVVVWHADGPGESVPAGCVPADTSSHNTSSIGDDGVCNVYVQPDEPEGAFAMAAGTALQPVEHYFGCTGQSDPERAHMLDCDWPSTSRGVLTSPRDSVVTTSTDYVGIYIQARHLYYTGVLGDDLVITDRSITLLEPQGYELS